MYVKVIVYLSVSSQLRRQLVKKLKKILLNFLVPNRFRDRQLPFHLLLGILLIKNPQLAVFMKKKKLNFQKVQLSDSE